jgi:hypothetical protein
MPGRFALQDIAESGNRLLLVAIHGGREMVVRRSGQDPVGATWLGASTVADISSDGARILFLDGYSSEKSYGSWLRPVSGGDAVRLGNGIPSAFSPDGRSVVATTSPLLGPPQVLLIPVGPGAPRTLTSSAAVHAHPAFAGPDTILFLRSEGTTSEIWRMAKDGTAPRSLGAAGCDLPAASPVGDVFLVRCGESKGELEIFPMTGGAGRSLHALPEGQFFVACRFDRTGREVLAVTSALRLLRIDTAAGRLLSDERLSLGDPAELPMLRTAALTADGAIQVYSFDRFSSGLYLADSL